MLSFLPKYCSSAWKVLVKLLAQFKFYSIILKEKKRTEISASFTAKLNQTFLRFCNILISVFFTSHFWLGLEWKLPEISQVSLSCEISSAVDFYFFVIY